MTVHSFDTEIFSAGTWNGDKYTVTDLDDMVANFAKLKDTVKPPVKLGHNEKQPLADGQMALGWVENLKRIGDKLVATLSQVPDVLYKAIKAGRYKRVSSEIMWNYKHAGETFKKVLSGVALLGADIPAVGNLADLEAFLSQSTGDNPGSFDGVRIYSFATEDSKIKNPKQGATAMSDELLREYRNKVAAAEADLKAEKDKLATAKATAETALKAEKDKLAVLTAEKVANETEAKEYKEKLAELETKTAEAVKLSKQEDLKTFCEAQVKAGKMTPGGRDIICKELDKLTYSNSSFSIPVEMFKEYQESFAKVILPKGESGKNEGGKTVKYATVQEEVDGKVKEYMAANKEISYVVALDAVLTADDKLAQAYVDDAELAHEED